MNNPWLYRSVARPQATARLFCFAHAGVGGAVYRLWPSHLPAELEVCAIQLPGRTTRLREAPIASIPALVERLLPALQPHLDLPFAFFGHSMGAVLAREVAAGLARQGDRQPAHLFVSGRRPPWMADPQSPMRFLTDTDFVAEITRRYGGIPPEVMSQPDLMELLLPALRADIEALELFQPPPAPALACPITACGGSDDRLAPRAHLDGWRAETTGSFEVCMYPGDHFYLEAQRVPLLADVSRRLAPMVRAAREAMA